MTTAHPTDPTPPPTPSPSHTPPSQHTNHTERSSILFLLTVYTSNATIVVQCFTINIIHHTYKVLDIKLWIVRNSFNNNGNNNNNHNNTGASPGFGRGGANNFFFQI